MISSPNLGAVIARLESAEQRIPAAIQSAVRPDLYLSNLARIARETLAEQFSNALTPDQEATTIAILSTFALRSETDLGFKVSMGGRSAGRLPEPEDYRKESYADFIDRDAMINWIRTYKELTEADVSASGELPDYKVNEIVYRILGSIRDDPAKWFSTDRPGHGAMNPTGLVQTLGIAPMDAGPIGDALIAILGKWSAYVRGALPITAQRAIHQCFAPKG